MKKTIYTFLFILLGLLSAKAQTILDVGFETTTDPFYVNVDTPVLNSANAHSGSNCLYFAPAKGTWSQANNLFESNKWYHFSFWIKSSNPGELKLDHMPSDAYAVMGKDTLWATDTQEDGHSVIKIRDLVSFDASNYILVACDVYSGTASLYAGFGAAGNLVIGWWGDGSYFDDWKIEGFDPNANWNFIPNGSFEADGLPWVYAWGDETIAKFSTDTNSAVGGKNSLMIEVVKPSSSSWYDAGITNNFIIEVEKDSTYAFKFDAKAASARKMQFDVKVGEIKLLDKAIDLTDQVQTFVFPFVASTSGSVSIQLMPTISGATVYMDNFVFEKVKKNQIVNGDFEGNYLPWVYAWGDESIAKFSTDVNSTIGGKNSLMIEVKKPSASSWYDIGIKNDFLIFVEKDKDYTFSFDAKSASDRKMQFDVKVGELKLLDKAIDLTTISKNFSFPFKSSVTGSVIIQLMPTISGATVYFDNMVFEESAAVVPTGIKTEFVNFSVYPNPATDRINIKGENMKIVEILSIDGRILQSVKCTSQNEVIDIHHLKPGIYAARIIFGNNKTLVNRFVKQ